MLKKYLPFRIKQLLWFIFKSPQRKYGGNKTIWTDVVGWVHLCFQKSTPQPITLCTGLKNRSKPFLEVLLPSLNHCKHLQHITLSVFDCASTDVPNLKESIEKIWKGPLIFHSEERDFTRAYTFNKAIEQSPSEIIFACDADMQVPVDLVELITKNVSTKSAWFPISYHLDKEGKSGKFKTEGKGIFAALKAHFNKVGKYNTKYKQWGEEDWDLFFRFYQNGIRPHRTWEKELIHHYHPSLRPKGYETTFK